MIKRKRAAGGGRRPKGPFSGLTSSLTIRIPAEMRQQLEDAAQRSGNISQELLRRLADSFYRDRDRARDPAMRALCFLIAETAHQAVGIHLGEEERPIGSWRDDPFFFRAFKIAVGKLLDELEPPGPIRPPVMKWFGAFDKLTRSYETPQARGEYAADYIWNALLTAPASPAERENERRRAGKIDSPSAWREFYGMPDAARDLLKFRDKEKNP